MGFQRVHTNIFDSVLCRPWSHMRFVCFSIKYAHAGHRMRKKMVIGISILTRSYEKHTRLFFERRRSVWLWNWKLICKLSKKESNNPFPSIRATSQAKLSLSNFQSFIEILWFCEFVLTLNSLESFFCPNVSIVLIWKENYERFKIVVVVARWLIRVINFFNVIRGETQSQESKNPLTQFPNHFKKIK
jgi:hypothetical protein